MKITSAFVVDIRTRHRLENPLLHVNVDVPVEEAVEPDVAGKYEITSCGPFVDLRIRTDKYTTQSMWNSNNRLGTFNQSGVYKHQVAPVVVHDPEQNHMLYMSIERAKRLVRKYASSGWSYMLDEHHGLEGRMLWVLVNDDPACWGNDFEYPCDRPTVAHSWQAGVRLDFCSTHLRDHNDKMRNMRQRRESALRGSKND